MSHSEDLSAHDGQHANTSNQNKYAQDQPPPEILEDDSSIEEAKDSPRENAHADGGRYRDKNNFR